MCIGLREFIVKGEITWFTALNAGPTMQKAPRFVFSAERLFTAQAANADSIGDMNGTKKNMVFTEEAEP